MLNVLIVTSQQIRVEKNKFLCIENVYDILKRFTKIGTLHICASKYVDKSSNVFDCDLTELIDSKHIHFIKKTYLRTSQNSRKIIEDAVKEVDLVIGYVPNINATTALSYAKKYKKKYLSYVVGCPRDIFMNYGLLGKILAPYAYFKLHHTLKNSDFALYVTESFLQKRYPCPGINCGCSDVRIVNLDESILKNRLTRIEKIKDDEPLKIASIASYTVKYKGVHFVIEALARLKKMGITKFHYYLIGNGSKARLEKLSKKLDVEELIHFEGIIPHRKIFEKLDEMDIYIQPSLTEGLPRSVVEAMSRSLLCICSDAGAMPELVESDYIVRRKSVDDIVNVLLKISNDGLKSQARRNFEEAKKYQDMVLAEKRNCFFDEVKKNIDLN